MTLEIIRLITDGGLLVFIWAVQLIIYPSFKYYKSEDLFTWHQLYTKRVTIIVLPLMLMQLIISSVQAFEIINVYTISSLIIIALLWLSTFLIFVPLHHRISTNNFDSKTLEALVLKNWIRVFLWSILFTYSIFEFQMM